MCIFFKKHNQTKNLLRFRPRPELALRIKLTVSPTLEAPAAAVLLQWGGGDDL